MSLSSAISSVLQPLQRLVVAEMRHEREVGLPAPQRAQAPVIEATMSE